VLRPEIAVTAFAFLVPDLIDKPLWMLGVISDGRHIGHTLLVATLVAVAFSLKKRFYGLFAICGSISHLLLDTSGLVPWFYPFKGYDFQEVDYREVVTWHNVAGLLLELALVLIVVAVAVFLVLALSSWLKGRGNQGVQGSAGRSAEPRDKEQ